MKDNGSLIGPKIALPTTALEVLTTEAVAELEDCAQ